MVISSAQDDDDYSGSTVVQAEDELDNAFVDRHDPKISKLAYDNSREIIAGVALLYIFVC